MFNFYYVYLVVLVLALLHWAWMRYQLSRGLQIEFQKFRQTRSMYIFFEQFSKHYIAILAYTLVYVLFIGYSAIQLLYAVNFISLESVFFVISVSGFFIKDRIYYVTALYVLSKRGD